MDERILRLKTSQDARKFAKNARRLGHPQLEAQALEHAVELKAIEDGYNSPAQKAIATALYAYEEQQTRLKGRTFRANRTRQMLAKHGALAAAERMVLQRQTSTGFHVLEEAGLQELSFEAIIDHYPEEFSTAAVEAARARLEGRSQQSSSAAIVPSPGLLVKEEDDQDSEPIALDVEAVAFLEGFRNPGSWFLARWMPRYRKITQTIEQALADGRPQDLFDTFWKQADNAISHAGHGLLKYDTVESMRGELIQVTKNGIN